jgi:hypothetical protein
MRINFSQRHNIGILAQNAKICQQQPKKWTKIIVKHPIQNIRAKLKWL